MVMDIETLYDRLAAEKIGLDPMGWQSTAKPGVREPVA
jgi:hypothetical protein